MQEMLAPMAVPYSPDYFTPDENQQVRRQSIPFIYYDSKAGFKVSDEAERFLKSIKGRLGVIGVAGKYRTGKSFLLNRVILSKINEGFGVGPTINPCTKGLWVWGEPIHGKARDGSDLTIIVVDSEGIGSTNQDHNHDTRIFLLTLLLSSYFIFNSSGTIDENALQNLSLIVNLTKQLQVRSQVSEENDPQEIARYFPNFLWVVRDFSLKLVDQDKNSISAKQYLQNALKEKSGTSDAVMNKNRIRRLISLFFKERDCFTMVRPHEDEDKLQKLQTLTDQELREEFVRDINQLRNKIYVKVKPKQMNNKFVNGAMLLELAKSYVAAINQGSVPCIQNAWTYVCKNECERAIQQSISQYQLQLERRVGKSMNKITLEELKAISKELRDQSLAFFKSKAVGEVEEFENKLRDVIGEKFKQFKNRFFQLQREIIEEKIEVDLRDLDLNIRNGFYSKMIDFQQDLAKLKAKIMKQYSTQQGLADQILREMTEPLILKAADYITRSSETETNSKLKQLEEKLHLVEKESMQKKGELEREISKQSNLISHLEQER